MTQQEIFVALKTLLVESFEVDPEKVNPDAALYEELEVDSIDAVDLAGQLHRLTGHRLSPDDFKKIRTVNDLVRAVHQMTQQQA
jgi:acyl carrier protein